MEEQHEKSHGQEPQRSADLIRHTPRWTGDHAWAPESQRASAFPSVKQQRQARLLRRATVRTGRDEARQASQRDVCKVTRFLPTHSRSHPGGCAVSCSLYSAMRRVNSTTAPESPYHPCHGDWFRDGHMTQSEPMRFEESFPEKETPPQSSVRATKGGGVLWCPEHSSGKWIPGSPV